MNGSKKVDVLRHYFRDDVSKEISRFCKDRWVAVEASAKGRRIFHRYWRDGKPLTISEPADIKKMFQKFRYPVPRTIYASANIYLKLTSKEDLTEDNIVRVTPTWDIDGSLEEVDLIKKAAEVMLEKLSELGVEESVYLIWSGRGIHVHLNENAVSDSIWKAGALRVSYSIVEYVLREAADELRRICAKSKSERKLKVENIMDVQRVFTAPLSLHRELDLAAVAIDPDKLSEFDLSWCDIERLKHWRGWSEFVEGEIDELARKALESVKGLGERSSIGEREEVVMKRRAGAVRVGRFQVMALLQAARYYALKGDLEKAKSFGLNRAIFYAWAKRRGVGVRKRTVRTAAETLTAKIEKAAESLGDEIAYISKDGWFMIGDQIQRPKDFDRQIAYRFGDAFKRYWDAAVEYVKSFPREVLESQREFYEKVYLKVRDDVSKILRSAKSREEA